MYEVIVTNILTNHSYTYKCETKSEALTYQARVWAWDGFHTAEIKEVK